MQNRIYSLDSAKAIKAQGYGYLNAIHYLAPGSLSGANLCAHASAGCLAGCLGWESGQAGMVANDSDINSVRASRIEKAQRFMTSRPAYLWDMVKATALAIKAAKRKRLKLCARLNGSSDIGWEGVGLELSPDQAAAIARIVKRPIAAGRYRNIMALFHWIQFVDYTKNQGRIRKQAAAHWPPNYSLTFSRSETNESDALKLLAEGFNVAIVFAGGLPRRWNGFRVINGDLHDLRHLDPRGVIVGLSPKGRKAKRDESGFVIQDWRKAAKAPAKRRAA